MYAKDAKAMQSSPPDVGKSSPDRPCSYAPTQPPPLLRERCRNDHCALVVNAIFLLRDLRDLRAFALKTN